MSYVWTNEQPTTEGWYWFKETTKSGTVVCVDVIPISYEKPYGRDLEYGGYFYDPETGLQVDELHGQWAGPIEEPKEA